MADESDIVNAFKSVLTQVVYPAGVPGNGVSPLIGSKVSLMGGWPLPGDVDSAMASGLCLVSIFPRAEEKVTSRLNQPYLPVSQRAIGVTATVSGQTVTFGGTPAAGDLIKVSVDAGSALLLGASAFGYGVNSGDTPTLVATALAALIHGATSAGPVLTVPAIQVLAGVSASWNVVRETGRQEKLFQITVWAPKYDKRDAIAKALKPLLDLAYRIQLPDGTVTTTRYARSHQADELQKQMIYQRHLFYFAEWATTTAPQVFPVVTAPVVNLTAQ